MSTATVPSQTKSRPFFGVECRVSERHPCGLQTSCQPIAARGDKDMLWPAIIRDVSVGGVGLLLGRRFERGVGLAIEIPASEAQPGDTLLAKVMHTTPFPEGRWLLGCAFVSQLSDEELQGLLALARAQQAPPRPANPPAQQDLGTLVDDCSPSTIIRNSFRDFLVSGINFQGTSSVGRFAHVPVRRLFLAGTWPVAPGTVLKIKVANPEHNLPDVKIKVNSCSLHGGRWTLNYTFVEQPSANLMRAFGYTMSLMEF